MIPHASVSIAYLEELLAEGKSARLQWVSNVRHGKGLMSLSKQRSHVAEWKAQGYTYAPPCDNIRPDGQCAGHERKD